MKIFVKVKTRTRQERVEKIDKTNFTVSVKEAPEKGQANDAVIKALANFFHIPPYQVQIVSGHTSRQKIVEIF